MVVQGSFREEPRHCSISLGMGKKEMADMDPRTSDTATGAGALVRENRKLFASPMGQTWVHARCAPRKKPLAATFCRA